MKLPKKISFPVILVISLTAFCIFLYVLYNRTNTIEQNSVRIVESKKNPMKITSPAFEDQKNIPSKYTCTGENINPPLQFSDIPQEAKSLVLIVDDPDAPGGTWVHWVIYNITPSVTGIVEQAIPKDAIEANS